MPIGNRYRGQAAGPAFTPRELTSPGIGLAPNLPAVRDVWDHHTFPTAALYPPAGIIAEFRASDVCTRFKMLVIDATRVLVRFGDQDVDVDAGRFGYDLYHPGAGELDESVPPFTRVTLMSLGVLTYTVEVWCLGGTYALRPT